MSDHIFGIHERNLAMWCKKDPSFKRALLINSDVAFIIGSAIVAAGGNDIDAVDQDKLVEAINYFTRNDGETDYKTARDWCEEMIKRASGAIQDFVNNDKHAKDFLVKIGLRTPSLDQLTNRRQDLWDRIVREAEARSSSQTQREKNPDKEREYRGDSKTDDTELLHSELYAQELAIMTDEAIEKLEAFLRTPSKNTLPHLFDAELLGSSLPGYKGPGDVPFSINPTYTNKFVNSLLQSFGPGLNSAILSKPLIQNFCATSGTTTGTSVSSNCKSIDEIIDSLTKIMGKLQNLDAAFTVAINAGKIDGSEFRGLFAALNKIGATDQTRNLLPRIASDVAFLGTDGTLLGDFNEKITKLHSFVNTKNMLPVRFSDRDLFKTFKEALLSILTEMDRLFPELAGGSTRRRHLKNKRTHKKKHNKKTHKRRANKKRRKTLKKRR